MERYSGLLICVWYFPLQQKERERKNIRFNFLRKAWDRIKIYLLSSPDEAVSSSEYRTKIMHINKMFCVKTFLLCTGEMKKMQITYLNHYVKLYSTKKIVEHALNWVSIYFRFWLSTLFLYGAFCFVKFGDCVEITLYTFRQLQQSYLVRGCNLEITFLLDHQAQVICQC